MFGCISTVRQCRWEPSGVKLGSVFKTPRHQKCTDEPDVPQSPPKLSLLHTGSVLFKNLSFFPNLIFSVFSAVLEENK